jgi:hypothetical protein
LNFAALALSLSRTYNAAMAKSVITPEEGAELEALKSEYLAATRRAADAMQAHDSEAFVRADAVTSVIVRRVKEILGTAGQHWMA